MACKVVAVSTLPASFIRFAAPGSSPTTNRLQQGSNGSDRRRLACGNDERDRGNGADPGTQHGRRDIALAAPFVLGGQKAGNPRVTVLVER